VSGRYEILCGDAGARLAELPAQSVHCCVTSPPYYGLRDYGVDGQIGLEETPQAYIARLVEVFEGVKRALRDDGTLWIVIGDSYAGGGSGKQGKTSQRVGRANIEAQRATAHFKAVVEGCKYKDLIGIPWMLAFALRAAGWYLRQEIIWAKSISGPVYRGGACMPESVRDRCTRSHETIFMLSKLARYYYDHEAIREPAVSDHTSGNGFKRQQRTGFLTNGASRESNDEWTNVGGLRNMRSVWHVNPQPVKEAHFATFPEALVEPMIVAGCPIEGAVLDPFAGSGTTGIVALKHDRRFIGIELNLEYIEIAHRRLEPYNNNAQQEDRQVTDTTNAPEAQKPVHVVTLETNIRATPKPLTLAPLTLLVGPSGAGKSSIVDALCLSLTGASLTKGLGKMAPALKALAPNGATSVYARTTMSDETTVLWELAKDNKKPVWSIEDGVVPAQVLHLGVLDMLLGQSKGRMRAFLEAAGLPVVATGVAGIVETMPAYIQQRLAGVIPPDGAEITPAQLDTALTLLDSIAREQAAAVKAAEGPVPAGLSESELEELNAAQERQAIVQYLTKHHTNVVQSRDASRRALEQTKAALDTVIAGFTDSYALVQQAHEIAGFVRDRLNERAQEGGKCPVCGTHNDVQLYNDAMSRLRTAMEKFENAAPPGTCAAWQQVSERVQMLEARERFLREMLNAAAAPGDPNRLSQLQERKSNLDVSRALVARASGDALTKETLKLATSMLQRSASEVLPKACDIVRRRANRVLPRGWSLACDASGNDVKIALQRGKAQPYPVHTLSGSEKATVVAALAAALCEKREAPISLLIVDEVMYDKNTLKAVLKGLAKALALDEGPTQIVVCASEFSGKVPDGWLFIDVAKLEADDGAQDGE